MKQEDETLAVAVVGTCFRLADALEKVGEQIQEAVLEPIGSKAKVQRAQDRITKTLETLDKIRTQVAGLSLSLHQCYHPKQSHKRTDDIWVCNWCGKVWSGLVWNGHTDEPKEKE